MTVASIAFVHWALRRALGGYNVRQAGRIPHLEIVAIAVLYLVVLRVEIRVRMNAWSRWSRRSRVRRSRRNQSRRLGFRPRIPRWSLRSLGRGSWRMEKG